MTNPQTRHKCPNATQQCAAPAYLLSIAFSSEVYNGSREENASKHGKQRVERERSLRFGGSACSLRLLQAIGAEFLALLAVEPFLVGLLRALDRLGALGFLGLLGCRGGRRGGRGGGGLREGRARKQEASEGSRDRARRERHHQSTYQR